MYNTQLYSQKLANTHFWLGTLGIIFYAVPMYWAGWTQSLKWTEFTPEGILKWGNFLDTVIAIKPLYALRAVGGSLFFVGVLIGVYNLAKTAAQGSFLSNEAAEAPVRSSSAHPKGEYWHRWIERRPMQMLLASTILISIGGLIQILPMVFMDSQIPKISTVKPYTPLELQGRDIAVGKVVWVATLSWFDHLEEKPNGMQTL